MVRGQVGVGDDLEDAHADATFSAAGDVEGEDAGEELCPGDAPGSGRGRGRGFGGVVGEGEIQRALWWWRCGELGADALSCTTARASRPAMAASSGAS